jgi:hypothetical protein
VGPVARRREVGDLCGRESEKLRRLRIYRHDISTEDEMGSLGSQDGLFSPWAGEDQVSAASSRLSSRSCHRQRSDPSIHSGDQNRTT